MKFAASLALWLACLPLVVCGFVLGVIFEALQWGFVGGRDFATAWVESNQPKP